MHWTRAAVVSAYTALRTLSTFYREIPHSIGLGVCSEYVCFFPKSIYVYKQQVVEDTYGDCLMGISIH
jgi:hypothetical protein